MNIKSKFSQTKEEVKVIKLKEFNIANFWGEKSISINFKKNFTIITGHNGSGKSTVLELLHDTFSLTHNGNLLSLQTNWASEAKFVNGNIIRNFNLGRNHIEAKETKLKIQEIAKDGIHKNIGYNFEEITKFIKKTYTL